MRAGLRISAAREGSAPADDDIVGGGGGGGDDDNDDDSTDVVPRLESGPVASPLLLMIAATVSRTLSVRLSPTTWVVVEIFLGEVGTWACC